VYSGSGVNSLRSYLASRILEEDEADEFFINHEPEADTWDPQASWVSGGTDGPNEANGNGHGHYDPVPHAAAEPSSRGRQARDAQQRLV
jgi:hypothetical protein